MFKFGTVGKKAFELMACFSFVLLSSSVAFAADRSNQTCTADPDKVKQFLQMAGKKPDSTGAYSKEDINWATSQVCPGANSSSGGCGDLDKAKSDFNKARGEFEGACGSIPTGRTSRDGGTGIACSVAIDQCACSSKGISSEKSAILNCGSVDDDSSDDDSSTSATSNIVGLRDIGQAKKVAKYCPGKLGTQLEKLNKEATEEEKKLKDAQDKLPKLQDEMNKAQQDAVKDENDIKDQMAQETKQYNQDIADLQKSNDQKIKDLQTQLGQLHTQMVQLDDKNTQINLSRSDAEVAREEADKKVDLNCYATALAQVNKYQNDAANLNAANNLNFGQLQTLLQRVGLSDRQAWQKVAQQYYDWCIKSQPTMDSKDSNTKIYQSALQKANAAEASLAQQKKDLQAATDQIRGTNGCGAPQVNPSTGVAAESDMCQAMRQFQQDMQRKQTDHQVAQQQLAQKYQTALQSGQQNYMAKQKEFTQAQNDYNEEKTRLDNLRRYLDLANSDPGAGDDAKAYTNATTKLGTLKGNAEALVECYTKDNCDHDGTCKKAEAFIASYKGSDGVTYSEDTKVNPSNPNAGSTAPDDTGCIVSVDPSCTDQRIPLTPINQDGAGVRSGPRTNP